MGSLHASHEQSATTHPFDRQPSRMTSPRSAGLISYIQATPAADGVDLKCAHCSPLDLLVILGSGIRRDVWHMIFYSVFAMPVDSK